MYLYQYLIMAALCCLYFNKKTSLAAEAFLLGWLFYILVTMKVDVIYYYSITALVELIIGYRLNYKFRLISYMNYALVIVNLFGLYLYKNGFQPTYYDIIYAIISMAQVLLLLSRLGYGRIGVHLKYFMDILVDFDSRKARDTM